MTTFRFDDLTRAERYKMLCAAVIPRPVAWITSIDPAGVVNAAPYSFFNVFSDEPALVIIGIDKKADGGPKDSLTNIQSAGEFVVNLADTALVDAMVGTAALFPAGVGEPEALGLATAPGAVVGVPRLADAPISLECTLFEDKPVGDFRHLVIGEVRALHARPGLFDETTKRMTVPHYDPVARLFAQGYAKLHEPYEKPVPDWREIAKPAATAEETQ